MTETHPHSAAQPSPPALMEPFDEPPEIGLDLDAYDWVPILRKRRADGWSAQRQRDFIKALADTGSVATAAHMVGMSERSCCTLRRAPGSESFNAAWNAAIDESSRRLVDAAFERAIVGSEEPVFDKEGNRVGRRFRQSDKLLMFLLRAYMPERFRHAAHAVRAPDEAPPPPLVSVAEALDRLGPPRPAAPEALMSPDDLDCALDVATVCDGKLPHWLPDYRREEAERQQPTSFPDHLERALEDSRRANNGKAPLTDAEWAAQSSSMG